MEIKTNMFRIDKRNAVSVYLYTSLMGPWDLHVTAQEFILQHFEQVAVKSKDFCSLSRDQISRLISSDKLLVSSEGEVYKAVVSWVAHEPRARASLLPALLQHVHFPLMSMDEVRNDKFTNDCSCGTLKSVENSFAPILLLEALNRHILLLLANLIELKGIFISAV